MNAQQPLAVVTGAGGGIGRAVVDLLREQRWQVVGFDRVAGPDVQVLDVTHADAVAAAVQAVESTHGPIAGLVNGAGVLSTGTALDTTAQEWQRLFAVNTTSVFTVSTTVARSMVAAGGGGAIVTVASNSGRLPRHGMAAYGASKAAAALFTQSLGLELAQYGIRCNVVSPGTTRTPMVEAMFAGGGVDEAGILRGNLDTFKVGVPLQRIAEPEDIAAAVVYLLSDAARHVNMHDLVVDGGASLQR